MMTETLEQLDETYPLTESQVAAYRRDGFVQLEDMITGETLERVRLAVEEAVESEREAAPPSGGAKGQYEDIFIQKVNLWRRHETVRPLTLSRRLADVAARLSGMPVRIWHDQALFKKAREGAKTPWHQDAPYWSHHDRRHQLSIWIALRDATIQNGCMSFVPGTHTLTDLEPIRLWDPQDIFEMAPQFRGVKPQTIELKAGSCTYHNGLTFHYAGPNKSDGMREAFAIIYMPDGTEYSGKKHVVTDGLGLEPGERLEGELFPLVGRPGAEEA
jgi:phytanoyl-CoA hydroxylase